MHPAADQHEQHGVEEPQLARAVLDHLDDVGEAEPGARLLREDPHGARVEAELAQVAATGARGGNPVLVGKARDEALESLGGEDGVVGQHEVRECARRWAADREPERHALGREPAGIANGVADLPRAGGHLLVAGRGQVVRERRVQRRAEDDQHDERRAAAPQDEAPADAPEEGRVGA